MSAKNIAVVQDPEKPVAPEVLAEAIVKISSNFTKLLKSGLNRRAVVILVSADTRLPQYTIENVLNSLESLAKNYTR